MLSLRYPMEVNLHGHSRETLQLLIPLLRRKTDRGWREGIEADVRDWWEVLESRAKLDANPINPQRVFWELSPLVPEGAILTCDSGSAANWFARDIRVRRGMMASLSGNLATMGPGVPYAIAAKFAHPERPVIAMVGDGAMQMNGINGLVTIEKYWREWADPRLVILVLYNHDLNQVTWEQRAFNGDPKFEASQNLPDFPYAQYAEMLGLRGVAMQKPDDIVPGWQAALAADRPVVVEAHTDPEVPPLPPHISFDQAKAYAQAIVKGDPGGWDMIKQSVKNLAESYVPHRR
jgi:pyruvate dehydrogenase (quinone)